jgi:hypothetical protein
MRFSLLTQRKYRNCEATENKTPSSVPPRFSDHVLSRFRVRCKHYRYSVNNQTSLLTIHINIMESGRRTPSVTTRSRSRMIEQHDPKHGANDLDTTRDTSDAQDGGQHGHSRRTAKSPTKNQNQPEPGDKFWLFFKLARPKFLVYSLAMHSIGVLIAAHQHPEYKVDFLLFALLQMTIWMTHIVRYIMFLNRNIHISSLFHTDDAFHK